MVKLDGDKLGILKVSAHLDLTIWQALYKGASLWGEGGDKS